MLVLAGLVVIFLQSRKYACKSNIIYVDTLTKLEHTLPRSSQIASKLSDDLEEEVEGEAEVDGMIVGVDTEYHPLQGLCIIQITYGGFSAIIDILRLPREEAVPILDSFFGDPNIVKVIHGGSGDVGHLWAYGIDNVRSLWDTHVAANILNLKVKNLYGLLKHYNGLCPAEERDTVIHKAIEALDVDEKNELQRADWRIRPLTNKQQVYAVNDCRYLPWLRGRMLEELHGRANAAQLLSQFTNGCRQVEKHKMKSKSPKKSRSGSVSGSKEDLLSPQEALIKVKLERREKYDQKFSAKGPVYENCKILTPKNELLAYCDRKKINWYLTKGLAVIVDDPDNDELTIRLNFTPNTEGRAVDVFEPPPLQYYNSFYVQERANICVICGADKNYQRFSVVPKLYRRFLPEAFKSHRPHDIVLLCTRCHEQASIKQLEMIKETARNYSVPLNKLEPLHLTKAKEMISSINRSSVALNQSYDKIPVDRREFLIKPLREYFQTDDITMDIIREGMTLPSPDLASMNLDLHGRRVVSLVENYEQFILFWRDYFVKSMSPQHLPNAWAVDHRVNRTFGKNSKFANTVDEYGKVIVEHIISKYYGVEAVLVEGEGRYVYRDSISKAEFESEEQAVKSYDDNARKKYKSSALTNFPPFSI